MPGDAFAQLRNLSSHMAFAAASKTLGGAPDTLETEADWDTSNDERQPQAASCKPNIRNFVGLVLGPARGLTDTGAPQPVVGASAAQWWCGRDTEQNDRHLWWNRSGQSVTGSELSRWNRWCERSDAFLGARRARVA